MIEIFKNIYNYRHNLFLINKNKYDTVRLEFLINQRLSIPRLTLFIFYNPKNWFCNMPFNI